MGYIYKITNKITQKVYIGKTLDAVQNRWAEHCRDYKRLRCEKRPLYDAMNKYGIENFTIEEIEKCDDKILSEREKFWIEKYNSYIGFINSNGYNATLGGDGKSYLNYQEIIEVYKQNKNISKTALICKCSPDSVSKILKSNEIDIVSSQKIAKANQGKSVKQYSLKNEYITTFSSLAEAAQWLKDNNLANGNLKGIQTHIRDCALARRKTAYKFLWKF